MGVLRWTRVKIHPTGPPPYTRQLLAGFASGKRNETGTSHGAPPHQRRPRATWRPSRPCEGLPAEGTAERALVASTYEELAQRGPKPKP